MQKECTADSNTKHARVRYTLIDSLSVPLPSKRSPRLKTAAGTLHSVAAKEVNHVLVKGIDTGKQQ